jgi:hypothetical protein
MPQLFTNNARSTLQSTITDTATSLTIAAGAADLFPAANVGTGSVPSTDNWFKATLQDVSGNVEIIYVRTRNAGSAVFSNILRGQEGTTARAFTAGSVIGLRLTAADVQAGIGIPLQNNTFSGDNTFTGNNIYSTTNFTIEESGGELVFKHGSTVVASLSSAGVFTALTSVAAGGSV